MGLTPAEAVLIEDGEVVVGTNGIVDQQEETCLAEVVILLLEEADLNIRLLVTTPVQNTILEDLKDIPAEGGGVNIRIVIKDQGILTPAETNIDRLVTRLVKG